MEHFGNYTIVHQLTKKELVDAALSPDETERREIRVEGDQISMNSICLVAGVRRSDGVKCSEKYKCPQRTCRHDLEKNDFWMSKMGLTYRPL